MWLINNMQVQLLLSPPDISMWHHTLRCLTFFCSKWLAAFLHALLHNHHIWQSSLCQKLWNLKEQGLQATVVVARLLQLQGELFSPFPGQHQQWLIMHCKSPVSRLHSAKVGFWERSWADRVEWAGLCSSNHFTRFKLLKPYKLRKQSL